MSKLFAKIYLRHHARLILVITALSGFIASYVLLKYFHLPIITRYPVSAVIAYVIFVLLMQGWKLYLEDLPPMHREQVQKTSENKKGGWKDWIDVPDFSMDLDDLAIAIFVVVFFVVLVYGTSFLLFELPVLMIEVVLSGLTTSLYYKKIQKADQDIFIFKAIRQTALIGILTVFIYLGIAISLTAYCPTAEKLSDLTAEICQK